MRRLRLKEPCHQKLQLRHRNRLLWIRCQDSKSLLIFFAASYLVTPDSVFVVYREMMLFGTVKTFRNFVTQLLPCFLY